MAVGPSGQTPIQHLPFPTEDDDVDPSRDIEALAMALDPKFGTLKPGMMMMWPGAVAPAGWYFVQGPNPDVTADENPGLNALLGNTGGVINLPDYRDRFPVGVGVSHALGQAGGAETVTLTTAQTPSHSHNVQGYSGAADRSLDHLHGFVTGGMNQNAVHSHSIAANTPIYNTALGGAGSVFLTSGTLQGTMFRQALFADAVNIDHVHSGVTNGADRSLDHLHYVNLNSAAVGGGASHENQPPWRGVNFIILGG